MLLHDPLLGTYKCFLRSHLDDCHIVFDKPNDTSFTSKLGKMQYKTCLAITEAFLRCIPGMSSQRTRS